MKMKVVCSHCNSSINWCWGNFVARCEVCDALLNIKDVKIDRESRQVFMPGA